MADPTLVPVEALTALTDRFRCDRLHAELSVRSCVAQHLAPRPSVACATCTLGAHLAVRFPVSPLPGCKVCGKPVKGAGTREPLCLVHRRKDVTHAR